MKLPSVSRKPWGTRASHQNPDDLPRVVDAVGERKDCAGHIDLGEAAAGVEKTVGARAIVETPDDLPRVVDAAGCGRNCARDIDLGEAAAGVEEAVLARAAPKIPTICPASLMPVAAVENAPGTSIWVKLPPVSRNP